MDTVMEEVDGVDTMLMDGDVLCLTADKLKAISTYRGQDSDNVDSFCDVMQWASNALEGAAARAGFHSEKEMQEYMKRLRKERREKLYARR